jgi:hypothetical protein
MIPQQVRFASGHVVHLIQSEMVQPQAYLLNLAAGQTLYVHAPQLQLVVQDPAGRAVSGRAVSDATAYTLPTGGDYTLTAQGTGRQLILHVPPLGQSLAGDIPLEQVRFASGSTGTILEVDLTPDDPQGYLLGIRAGQRLQITVRSGDVTLDVWDPAGERLTPYGTWSGAAATYLIPRSGDYTLTVQGSGTAQIGVEIPPR